MAAPKSIDRLLREFRDSLLASEQKLAAQLLREYRRRAAPITNQLRGVTDELRRQAIIGEASRWIRDNEAAARLLVLAEAGMAEFGAYAAERIDARRERLIEQSVTHDDALTYAIAAGPGEVTPATAQALRSAFTAIPTSAVENVVGALQPGSPVRELFDTMGPDASRSIGEKLVDGVTRGLGSEQIARSIREDLDGNAVRALTISRTEGQRAYTNASLQRYRSQPKVYAGWRWHANLDGLTCPVCVAMDGTAHSLEEEFGTHPQCRCRPLPILRPLTDVLNTTRTDVVELDSEMAKRQQHQTGVEWFAKQPEAVQRSIVGRSKYEAIRKGQIELGDTVVTTDHPKWGMGRSTASLDEAKRQAKGRTLARSRMPSGTQSGSVRGGEYAGPVKVPPPPKDRSWWGDEGNALWDRAHREMELYDRVPTDHLIDSILLYEEREGLQDIFGELAGTTLMPGGKPDEIDPTRTVWVRSLNIGGTLVDVTVVLESDGHTIVTAFPS